MRDFEAYYAAGSVWDEGGNAYSQQIWRAEQPLDGVSRRRYEALPFVGPPAVLPLFGAIAHLSFATANVLWRTALIVAMAALALLALHIAQQRVTAPSVLAISVAALGFGPLTSAFALGQLALPAFVFAAAAVFWPAVSVFAWAQPNVALTQSAQLFSKRSAVAFLGGGAVFGLACLAVAGAAGVLNYVALLHRHGIAEQFSAIQLTPASIAYGFGAAPLLAARIGLAGMLAALCFWLILMRSVQDTTQRFCGTCALLPFAVPFFHEHDLLVLFVPAILYATRSAAWWPLAAFGALLAATDWLGLAQRPDGFMQTLLLIGGLGAATIALHERPRAQMLFVPGAVLVLITVMWLAVRNHVAPVWPDAMGPLPADIATRDIAAAWAQQQRSAGLFAQNPAWAALRMLSLSGAAMLTAAVALSSKSPADSKRPLRAPA
jgi:hypothetical protein